MPQKYNDFDETELFRLWISLAPVDRSVSELIWEVKAIQHVRATGEATPSGWQPGKMTLKTGSDFSGQRLKGWNPGTTL